MFSKMVVGGYVLQRSFFLLGEHDAPSQTKEDTNANLHAGENLQSATPLRESKDGHVITFCHEIRTGRKTVQLAVCVCGGGKSLNEEDNDKKNDHDSDCSFRSELPHSDKSTARSR